MAALLECRNLFLFIILAEEGCALQFNLLDIVLLATSHGNTSVSHGPTHGLSESSHLLSLSRTGLPALII